MSVLNKKWLRDAVERVLWTVAQAGVGALAVELADVPPAYGVLVAAVLATAKTYVAKHVGDPSSAALRPGE